MEDLIERATRDIVAAEYAIALTGAGISTESGFLIFEGLQESGPKILKPKRKPIGAIRNSWKNPKRGGGKD